jgi:hypothetical protein
MDFNSLMAKMRELDQPAAVEECGMAPMNSPSMPPMPSAPEVQPPSLSINLNAQGMDNIESIMKLVTKVNPDMINQPAPSPMPMISPEPSIMSIKPQGLGDLGNLDSGPLKMLPDLDSTEPDGGAHAEPDADNFGGPSDNDADNKIDTIQKSMGDLDNDSDLDSDDREMDSDEEEEEDDKKEAFGNSMQGDEGPEYSGIDAAIPDGNDLNKPKSTFPKVAGGDNPMQRTQESTDLRTQIRNELARRLAEAKGAK